MKRMAIATGLDIRPMVSEGMRTEGSEGGRTGNSNSSTLQVVSHSIYRTLMERDNVGEFGQDGDEDERGKWGCFTPSVQLLM